jgi:predicted ATPase
LEAAGSVASAVRPASASADVPRHNLPEPTTSFVGRQAEVTEVMRRLVEGAGASRLITLTGTGGSGKTRLALQVASRLLGHFPGGAWFVDLAALTDPSLVPQAVASALEIREVVGRSLGATLVEQLRRRELLLILDNCEHLIAVCAQLADLLLQGCPSVRILATSRELLGVRGETTFRVPSLQVPDPEHLPPLEVLVQGEAVALFVERARAVAPAFAVTALNAPSLVRVCQRLDGIPLAIELAAARARVLTVEQIAARLDDRFRLLTGGSRTALRRQQTLRALVDWSHDLLAEPERILFRRLGVFVGGWTLEAAEGICGEGDGDRVLGAGSSGTGRGPTPNTQSPRRTCWTC